MARFGNFAGGLSQGLSSGIGAGIGMSQMRLAKKDQADRTRLAEGSQASIESKLKKDAINLLVEQAATQSQNIWDSTDQVLRAISIDANLSAEQKQMQMAKQVQARDQAIKDIVGPVEQTLTMAGQGGIPVVPGSLRKRVNAFALGPSATQQAALKAADEGEKKRAELQAQVGFVGQLAGERAGAEAQVESRFAGDIARKRAQAQKDVEGEEFGRRGMFSPSLGARFEAVEVKGDPRLYMRRGGALVPAPDDAYPVTTQATGAAQDVLGLSKKTVEELSLAERGTAAKIDDISDVLKRSAKSPGAGGVRGLLSEKVGGVIGQLPGFGKESEDAFVQFMSSATPEQVQEVRTAARRTVAQLLTEMTGEESGRFTETERQITEQALKALDAGASFAQISTALKTVMKVSVNEMLRDHKTRTGSDMFDVSKDEGINRLGAYLTDIGLTEDEVLEFIRDQIARTKRGTLRQGEKGSK